MVAAGPINTVHLYGPLHQELIRLLEKLTPAQWLSPTVCRGWAVRDIAAHLLDVDIRPLSFSRDQIELPAPDPPIESYAGLVGFLNRLNADWVNAARRISPRLLIEFLRLTGEQLAAHLATVDMSAPTRVGVAWAGESVSANWFHIARDYTERWHHQQQIRDAVNAPPLTSAFWLSPVLDTFMRALPYHYRELPAEDGNAIVFAITGEAGGDWTLLRVEERWQLFRGAADHANARVTSDQDTAWRRFTKGITADEARQRMKFEGDPRLGDPLPDCLAIMA